MTKYWLGFLTPFAGVLALYLLAHLLRFIVTFLWNRGFFIEWLGGDGVGTSEETSMFKRTVRTRYGFSRGSYRHGPEGDPYWTSEWVAIGGMCFGKRTGRDD